MSTNQSVKTPSYLNGEGKKQKISQRNGWFKRKMGAGCGIGLVEIDKRNGEEKEEMGVYVAIYIHLFVIYSFILYFNKEKTLVFY